MSDAAPGLVVPMRLEALLVGAGDADDDHFLPPFADFSRLPYKGGRRAPYLGSEVVSRPFTGNAPTPQGIHLHWLLPQALRRGAYDRDGRLRMPRAPDRWLVTRVLVGLDTPREPAVALRSWVVESDYLAGEPLHSPTSIPRPPAVAGGKPYAFLGRVYDYDEWLRDGDQGAYLDELTALGFGAPGFASHYPSCRNVFGFLDATLNADELRDAALAYVVGGWYRRAEYDPLHDRPIDGAGNELGWRFDAAPGEVPAYSLFTGVVRGLPWDPATTYFPDYDVSLNPDVAVGNTPGEGFAALAAYLLRSKHVPGVERILNALQLGLLRGLDEAGGLARLEEGLYDASLSSVAGGHQWDVRVVPGSTDPEQPVDPLAAIPYDVADDLAELNTAQGELDRQSALAEALRGQVYADWQKFMQRMYGDPGPGPDVNEIYAFVSDEVAALERVVRAVEELSARVDSLGERLAARLPRDAELASLAGPRWYRPNDPVLVLSGDGVPQPPPDDAAEIRCVLTSRLVARADLPAGLVPGSAAVSLDADALPTIPDADRLPHPVVARLVRDELLLDAAAVAVPTAAIAAEGGDDNPAVLDFATTAEALAAAQDAFLGGNDPDNGIAFDGAMPQPDIAFRAWTAEPWRPIALSWQFSLFPPEALGSSGGDYPARYVADNFRLDPASLDYRLRSERFSSTSQEYAGTVMLSPDASIGLRREIEDYLRYEEDVELRRILADLEGLGVLAQSLGGFDGSLLMLGDTLQLPVADPLAATPIYSYFSNDLVPHAVAGRTLSEPLAPYAYNPLRAGKVVLRRLVLIDEFGRYRSVNLAKLVISETIPTAADEPRAMLPPLRIAQPVQAGLRWLSAANPEVEATSLPSMTPICGWVVPNHLDGSLMLYDGDGDAIGTLFPSGDGRAVLWQVAPGTASPSQDLADSLRGRNPVLAAFARSVVEYGGGHLRALVHTFDRTRTFIAPSGYAQDRQTAVLVGAPLALAQAAVDTTLMGLPSPDQSYAALQRDIDRGDPLDRTVRGFPDVELPLVLGSLEKVDDGLVGFWLDDFERFYAAAADGSDPHIVRPRPDTVTLSLGGAPKRLTMLVDPRCDVHAFNGLTRVKAIGIPAQLRARALQAMAFTFLTSPVLPPPGPFAIPVPVEADGQWTWVAYRAAGWEESDIAPVNFGAAVETPPRIAEGWLKLSPNRGANE